MKMDFIDYYMGADTCRIALDSLEVSIEGFKAMNRCPTGNGEGLDREFEISHFTCTYSRYVHINVWEYRVPIVQVRNDILPEFDLALKRVQDLASAFTGSTQAQHVKVFGRNLYGRKQNLSERYCQSLPSVFRFDLKHVPNWLAEGKDSIELTQAHR